MKQIIITLVALGCCYAIHGQTQDWYINFRDAVYGQNISIAQGETFFNEAKLQSRKNLNGAAFFLMLSRCEYLFGKVYQDNNHNKEAISRYERGITYAEESLKLDVSSGAYEMLAANYGQLCMIRSTAWVIGNGLKVLNNAKKAIQIDNRNAAAHYILASQYAFGPGIYGNPKRGISDLDALLNGNAVRGKDDYFNIYSALGYAYQRLENYQEALSWTQRALQLYPTNKFVLNQYSEIQLKIGETR